LAPPTPTAWRGYDLILVARNETRLEALSARLKSETRQSVKALRKAMHRATVVRSPRDSEQAVNGEVIVTTSGMLVQCYQLLSMGQRF